MKPKGFLAVLAILALSFLVACGGTESTPAPIPGVSPTSVPKVTGELGTPVNGTAAIIKVLRPSVVHIQTEALQLDSFNRPVPAGGVGTGEIIDNQGHILTNNHVIEGRSEYW